MNIESIMKNERYTTFDFNFIVGVDLSSIFFIFKDFVNESAKILTG